MCLFLCFTDSKTSWFKCHVIHLPHGMMLACQCWCLTHCVLIVLQLLMIHWKIQGPCFSKVAMEHPLSLDVYSWENHRISNWACPIAMFDDTAGYISFYCWWYDIPLYIPFILWYNIYPIIDGHNHQEWDITINNRLVGGLEHLDLFFQSYWECHHPNWRTHIFQRGRYTTNQ